MLHGGEIYGKTIEHDFSVNLNPLPCPESVMKALEEAARRVSEYPDIHQRAFREAVAASEPGNITAANVIGGNGASELLAAVVRYVDPRTVLLPIPSFSGYRHALGMLDDCDVRTHMLSEENDFGLDSSILAQIDEGTDLLILANPNNPTGRCIDDALLAKIVTRCRETKTAVLIDECFLPLSSRGTSLAARALEIPRLFVVKAYTKLFSVPGVRVGYALAGEEEIEGIRRFLPEWNLSVFAERAGIACAKALEGGSFAADSVKVIEEGRDELTERLTARGIRVFPSDTNYLLVKSRENLLDYYLKKHILIRDCANFEGLSQGYYRIAVKSADENRLI